MHAAAAAAAVSAAALAEPTVGTQLHTASSTTGCSKIGLDQSTAAATSM